MKKLFSVLLLFLLLATGPAVIAQSKITLPDLLASKIQGNYFIYGDYRFDVSEILNDEHLEAACNECIRQVGYIESANLPKNITNFFKTVPVTLLPQDQLPQTSASSASLRGMYLPSESAIVLNIDGLYQNECDDYKDQTLLHELLHAFHHQRLGSNNLAILKFFKEAKDHHYYNSENDPYANYLKSQINYAKLKTKFDYMMRNDHEFFACTSMAFLNDFAPYEPFNRNNIYQYQPEYYHYLENLFQTGHDPYTVERSLFSAFVDYLY